ncbi:MULTISPECIES: VOC family protein [unclassified Brevundimonas]|uniref:VOC family protein n=1 Tax=unclassified Brevundimonas TaxID=2622653 RepID=UPI0025BC84CD|nr:MULTISPECIES: VOC family protein [unclassified Brevundimonas]
MIQLGYFTLDTPDIEKARAFYASLFGWTFDDDSSHPTYAHVNGSDPAFGITKGEHRAFPHLYFRVDDIHAVCARVKELGGHAAMPAESPSGLSAVVADDQGVSFSLWQPAPGY